MLQWLSQIWKKYGLDEGSFREVSNRKRQARKLMCKNYLMLSHWVVPDFCDPLDCSPPGSSVYGISQARILEWVAISFSSNWKYILGIPCRLILALRKQTKTSGPSEARASTLWLVPGLVQLNWFRFSSAQPFGWFPVSSQHPSFLFLLVALPAEFVKLLFLSTIATLCHHNQWGKF